MLPDRIEQAHRAVAGARFNSPMCPLLTGGGGVSKLRSSSQNIALYSKLSWQYPPPPIDRRIICNHITLHTTSHDERVHNDCNYYLDLLQRSPLDLVCYPIWPTTHSPCRPSSSSVGGFHVKTVKCRNNTESTVLADSTVHQFTRTPPTTRRCC